jgi:sugar-specific transcriptional regulator TrmB
MLQGYLQRIGLDPKEQSIYMTLAQIGVAPASVVARKCGLDRVTTYKHLKKLAERGLVKIYYEKSIQCFGVEDFESIQSYLKERMSDTKELLDQFPTAMNVLRSFAGEGQLIPKLQIFEGEAGIKSCFRDLLFEAREQKLKQIRMLTSNTFEEKLGEVPLSKFVRELFADIRKSGIEVQMFEASGTLIPERLRRVPFEQVNPDRLPGARGATNIFIVGKVVYLTCYRDSQIGLKIKHAEISQIFHFLFDLVGRQAAQ